MANVKVRAGSIRNAVGAPLSGKVATLRDHATDLQVGSTVNTDPNGQYSFPNLPENVRYRVEVAFGGGSSQMYVNSPTSPDLDHAYINSSLRSAPGATVAFGGPVSVGGVMTAVGGITVSGAAALNGGGTVTGPLNFAAGSKVVFADELKDDKITLWSSGGVYSIGIRSGTLAYFAPVASHRFFVNGVDTFAVGSGNATLAGTLAVSGLASLNGGLGVTGASTLNGPVNAASLSVAGAVSLPANSITNAMVASISPAKISPQGGGSGLNADLLDGMSSNLFATDVHNHNSGNPGTTRYLQMRSGNYTGNNAANRTDVSFGLPVPTDIALCIITEQSAVGTTWISHGVGYGAMMIPAAAPSGDEVNSIAGHIGISGGHLTLNAGSNPGYGANFGGSTYTWCIIFYI